MNCRTVLTRITALLDEALPAATASRVRAHLDTCPNCAQALQEQIALRKLTAVWSVEGDDVWEAVRAEIEPDAFAELRAEMQRLRGEVKALHTEVALLRAQVAASPTPGVRRPSPMLPYPQPTASTRIRV